MNNYTHEYMHANNTTVWLLVPAQWPNFLLTLV